MDSQAGQLLLDIGLVAVLVVVGVRFYRRRRAATAAPAPATDAPERREISSRHEARRAAEAHLTGLGFTGVRSVGDESLDLTGDIVSARVAWRAKPVGADELDVLRAEAGARRVVLYSFAGCTRAARRSADDGDVALFRLRVDGTAVAENEVARALEAASA